MTTFLWVALASIISYHIGRKVGIAYTMMRMQGIIDDMQRIQSFFQENKKQWNEDNL